MTVSEKFLLSVIDEIFNNFDVSALLQLVVVGLKSGRNLAFFFQGRFKGFFLGIFPVNYLKFQNRDGLNHVLLLVRYSDPRIY